MVNQQLLQSTQLDTVFVTVTMHGALTFQLTSPRVLPASSPPLGEMCTYRRKRHSVAIFHRASFFFGVFLRSPPFFGPQKASSFTAKGSQWVCNETINTEYFTLYAQNFVNFQLFSLRLIRVSYVKGSSGAFLLSPSPFVCFNFIFSPL